MSLNRDNVTWQSKDGKWNIGFWDFYNTKSYDDPDFDHEWDVEYSSSEFWFLSRGHSTPEQAYAAYTRNNANPGGTRRPGNSKELSGCRSCGLDWLAPPCR